MPKKRNTIYKKIQFRLLLGLVFVLPLILSNIPAANAATAGELQTQIQQLQEQIEQLQARIKILQQQLGGTSPTEPEPPSVLPGCRPVFLYTLYRGVSDKRTGGEVTKLQKILAEDPTVYPEGLVTGYYGLLTEKAVQRWQAKQGIISSGSAATTGYGVIGPQTRAKMIIVCPPMPPLIPPPITVLSPNGGETWTKGTTQTITWRDSMLSRPAGGEVLYGPLPARYYDINLIPYYPPCTGNVCPLYYPIARPYTIAKSVSGFSYSWSAGKYLEILGAGTSGIAPDGSYKIQVCQTNSKTCDSSDNYLRIVSGDVSNLPPTISGVSGPSTLKVGEIGKWEVKASDPEQGPLTYSVVWGDEVVGVGVAERAVPASAGVPAQTATFTHAYSKTGNYVPVFTVTDNGGLSAKTSISVSVDGDTSTVSITSLNPESGPVGTPVTLTGTGFSTDLAYPSCPPNTPCPRIGVNGNNTVRFGPATLSNVISRDGKTLTFQVPGQYMPPCPVGMACSQVISSVAPGTYDVFVSNANGMSNSVSFTVTSSKSDPPQVLSPNGGETWQKGTTQTIRWYAPPISSGGEAPPRITTENIDIVSWSPPCSPTIRLLCPSPTPTFSLSIAKDAPKTDGYNGEFKWTIPASIPNGRYVIRISNSLNPKLFDDSNAPFGITSASTAVERLYITGRSSVGVGQTVELQAFYQYQPAWSCPYLPGSIACSPPSPLPPQLVEVQWTSSNSGIAAVSYKSGDRLTAVVSGVSAGTAVIKAFPASGSALAALTATINITVAAPSAAAGGASLQSGNPNLASILEAIQAQINVIAEAMRALKSQ